MKIPLYIPTYSASEKEKRPESHQTLLSDDGKSVDFGLFVDNLENHIGDADHKFNFPKAENELILNTANDQMPVLIGASSNLDKQTETKADVYQRLNPILEAREATSTNLIPQKYNILPDGNALDFDKIIYTAEVVKNEKGAENYVAEHSFHSEDLAIQKIHNLDNTPLKSKNSLEESEEFHNLKSTKDSAISHLPHKESQKSFPEIRVSNLNTEDRKFQTIHHTQDSYKATEAQHQQRLGFDPLEKEKPADGSYPTRKIASIEAGVMPLRITPAEPTPVKNDPPSPEPILAPSAKVITSPIVKPIESSDASLSFDRYTKNAAPQLKPDLIGGEPVRSAISVQPSLDGTDIKFLSPNKDVLESMLRHQQELRASFRDLGLENYTFSFQNSGGFKQESAQKQTTLATADSWEKTPDMSVTYDIHPQSGLDIRI